MTALPSVAKGWLAQLLQARSCLLVRSSRLETPLAAPFVSHMMRCGDSRLVTWSSGTWPVLASPLKHDPFHTHSVCGHVSTHCSTSSLVGAQSERIQLTERGVCNLHPCCA